jgi:hypothetical protein
VGQGAQASRGLPTRKGKTVTTKSLTQTLSETWAQASALVTSTIALVKAQWNKDKAKLGAGSGLLGGALLFVLAVPPLLVLAFVWGLIALGIWPWAAYLIAAAFFLLVAGACFAAAKKILKGATESTKRTMAVAKDSLYALAGSDPPPPEAPSAPEN